MIKNKKVHDLFYLKCKHNNIKITPQRIAIYKELSKSKDHPTVEMIFNKVKKKIPHITFDTVNRTLKTFYQIGLTDMVACHGAPKRFDPDKEAHHHYICIKCNRIIDFKNSDYNSIPLPKKVPSGFEIINKKIIIEVICSTCKN